MQCPQCGHLNEDAAQVCTNCGSILLVEMHPPHRSPSGPPEPQLGPIDAVWRDDEPGSEGGTPHQQDQQIPDWLASIDQETSPPEAAAGVPPQGLPAYPTNLSSPASENSPAIGPIQWDSPGVPPSNPEAPFAPAPAFYPSNVPPSAGSHPYAAPPDAGDPLPRESGLVAAPRLSLPSVGNPQLPAEGPTALVQPLGPGTLLKGARYRLIQRFHPFSSPQSQDNEPELMIASDTELPNGRVLVQELLLHAARPEDAEYARHFVVQRLQALAQSGNVPAIVDHFTERRRHFLVFEMPAGDLLFDRLQRTHGPLEETVAIGYALQLLDILATFERQQPAFVHGNICPANIILRPSGQFTLVGFSPSLLMHPDGIVSRGQTGGVPGYAAPEQLRGQVSTRVDLFAICAVLHHMVTGAAPSPRPGVLHQPARRLNPNVSLELEEVLSRGLRPSSIQRFQSVAEFRAALQPLASGRLTHVPADLRAGSTAGSVAGSVAGPPAGSVPGPPAGSVAAPTLAPLRDAHGRLVLPRQKLTQNPLFLIGLLLAIVLIAGAGLLYAVSSHPPLGTPSAPSAPSHPTTTPNEATSLFQTKGIGLSGGELIFDTQRSDDTLKQEGARSLATGDNVAALESFQNAMSSDQADAEAAIYTEDLRVLLSSDPYVTVVAAVALGQDDATAQAELQGVFLAQQHINSLNLLPNNTRVRVLILNSGQDPNDASTACKILLDELSSGNAQHIIGIVGWPSSTQMQPASAALASSGLATVSPTASADHLGDHTANFFALVPSDSHRAAELAGAAVNHLKAHHILVLGDPQDARSNAIASSFAGRITQAYTHHGVTTRRLGFTTGTTIDFASAALTAFNQGDDLIFLAGNDQDAVYLAQAVAHLDATTGASLRILADSRADTPALFGLGDSAAAQAARANPNALATLYVTSLADPGEWNLLGIAQASQPTFYGDYTTQFGLLGEPHGLPTPDSTTVLSYDAARVLLAADARGAQQVGSTIQLPDPSQVPTWLRQYGASNPFIGVAGAIAFTRTGEQPVKALAIEKLKPIAGATSGSPVAQTVLYAVAGDRAVFCGATTCKAS